MRNVVPEPTTLESSPDGPDWEPGLAKMHQAVHHLLGRNLS
jgi:hypothetical protein